VIRMWNSFANGYWPTPLHQPDALGWDIRCDHATAPWPDHPREGADVKTYHLTVPFAGAVVVSVQAETEDEAKDKALDAAGEVLQASEWHPAGGGELVELEAYRRIVSGNCLNINQNEITVDEVEGGEDE
jgi:hypothetical protein